MDRSVGKNYTTIKSKLILIETVEMLQNGFFPGKMLWAKWNDL